VGAGQRSSEDLIHYRLGDRAATRRAAASALVGAATALAPVVLGIVVLERMGRGWSSLGGAFWVVVLAILALIGVRTAVQYGVARRRLWSLRVTVGDDEIATADAGDGYAIARDRVARIVEIDGALGGVRVESEPDPRSGVVFVANVPRGGDGFGDVRARLATWRAIERRSRGGPAVRLAVGVAIVAAIFFLPFVLDDFVGQSRFLAAALVLAAWAVMRWTMRQR
jgi:hypothetical protein